MLDVIVPSCKDEMDLEPLAQEILATVRSGVNLHMISGIGKSASQNRNAGLEKATSEIILMLDDDMTGLPFGWDEDLSAPLLSDPNLGIVSARLLNKDGSWGYMNSRNWDTTSPLVYVQIVPTACIAFRNLGFRFDEAFIGSGYEDTDFCVWMRHQGKRIAINNEVRAIHLHEQKGQKGNWGHNRRIYKEKWG